MLSVRGWWVRTMASKERQASQSICPDTDEGPASGPTKASDVSVLSAPLRDRCRLLRSEREKPRPKPGSKAVRPVARRCVPSGRSR
jgi:hypothetical protein